MSLKNIYIIKIKAQLVEWDNEFAQSKDKAKERGLAASDKFEDHIEKLCVKRDEVQSKIEELQEAKDNAWIYLEEDVDNAWIYLEEDVDNALEELREALKMSMLNKERGL